MRLSDLIRPHDWEALAQCQDEDPELWFPSSAVGANSPALAICANCPVKRQCLDKALAASSTQDRGVWGGTTEQQRREIRAGRLTPEEVWSSGGKVYIRRKSRAKKEPATHCRAGHEYTPETSRPRVDGHGLDCRICCAARNRAARARRRQRLLVQIRRGAAA